MAGLGFSLIFNLAYWPVASIIQRVYYFLNSYLPDFGSFVPESEIMFLFWIVITHGKPDSGVLYNIPWQKTTEAKATENLKKLHKASTSLTNFSGSCSVIFVGNKNNWIP